MRLSQKLFRFLLRAYPRHVRNKRGHDMWLTFQSHLHDARSIGWFAVLALWRREIVALWRGGRRARISEREHARAHRRRNPMDSKAKRMLGASALDLKLSIRMMAKYPGLTIVGGLGMAVAIAISAGSFGVIYSFMDPTLPLDEGDRIVSIQNLSTEFGGNPDRRAIHDFVTWRDELQSVDNLGAFRTIRRNLITSDGQAELARVAEMTASGFQMARVPPTLGRTLIEDDDREGALPVVVIGHSVWQSRFASDSGVLGETVRLGNMTYTVVGVMPDGFAFPTNHNIWVPLRVRPLDYEVGQGPDINIFGRLAPDVTFSEARVELTNIGERTAMASPETHGHLRPQVMPYTYPFFDLDDPDTVWAAHLTQLFISMLLVVVCVNVATLVYARTAMRQREIAVRGALGASRRRIVTQLFVEALVLSSAAAVVGFMMANLALETGFKWMVQFAGDTLPFWFTLEISLGTALYVGGLTLLAAAIVGVLPAVKATGRSVHANLQHLAEGGSKLKLGGTWTLLIVAQVAVAAAVLPPAVFNAWQWIRYGAADPGFATDEFLTARLGMDRDIPPTAEADAYRQAFDTRYADNNAALIERLKADPAVAEVTFAWNLPGGGSSAWIEFDNAAEAGMSSSSNNGGGETRRHRVPFSRVDVDYFDTFELPILMGRPFSRADLDTAATAVIVSRSMAADIPGGGDPLGRRFRHVVGTMRSAGGTPERIDSVRWYEIVGVVGDLPTGLDLGLTDAKRIYHLGSPAEMHAATLVMRIRGTAAATFAPRLREITASVDPSLQLREVLPLDEVLGRQRGVMYTAAALLAVAVMSVLLLSAAGIHALMSVTVTRRRREIGIRAALGAHPHRLLITIFTRAVTQLAVGVVVGIMLFALLDMATAGELMVASEDEFMGGHAAVLLPVVSVVVMTIGFLAALGPARRGLKIQPTEALRGDA